MGVQRSIQNNQAAVPNGLPDASPRSILTTPRSVRSVQSALSNYSERRAEAVATQNELYEVRKISVQRKDLRHLSRGQLRLRLSELGAARTEGEGLIHGSLVDTVLLWNALARFKDNEDEEKVEEALLALRDTALGEDLLRRALVVVGVPEGQRHSLSRKQSADLLHTQLLQWIAERRASNMDSPVSAASTKPRVDRSQHDPYLDSPNTSCDPPRDSAPQVVALPTHIGESSAERVAAIADDSTFDAFDADLAQLAGLPSAGSSKLARDDKFDAIDADLGQLLEGSAKESPPFATSQLPAQAAVPQERVAMPSSLALPPREADQGEDLPHAARDAKLGGAIDTFIVTSARKRRSGSDSARGNQTSM